MLSVSQIAGFLKQSFFQKKSMEQPLFLHVDTNSQKLSWSKSFGWEWSKKGVANLVSQLKSDFISRMNWWNWLIFCMQLEIYAK